MVRSAGERKGLVLFVRRRRQRRKRRLGHARRPLPGSHPRAVGGRARRGGGDGAQSFWSGRGVAIPGRGGCNADSLLPAGRRRLTRGYATSRENTSGSTLPPERTATATLFLRSTLPVITAASAT